MQQIAAPANFPAARRNAIRMRMSFSFRAIFTLLGMAVVFSSVALFVASAFGDMLVGMMAALVAFTAAAPVLGPVLGAKNRSVHA